jgi:thiamine-phosphate pyrophosphorylase
MTLDPLYPILPDANWMARLVPVGLRMVQLRAKGLTEPQTKAQIIASQAICNAHGCLLVVNDYWKLALECGCDAIHLGQEDIADADVAAIRAAGITLGISTHDENELKNALAANPDYVALGPVFQSSSKRVPWNPQGLDRVTQWRGLVPDIPLVAIGGITLQTGLGVLNAGADSVAVIGDITSAVEPEAAVKKWLQLTDPMRS